MFAYGKPSQVTTTTNICCAHWRAKVRAENKKSKTARKKLGIMNESSKMHVKAAVFI